MTLSFAGRDINTLSAFASGDLPDLLSPGYQQSSSGTEGRPQPRPSYSLPPEKPNLTGPIVKISLVVVVIGIILWFLLPHPAAIPTSYTKFTTPDNILACDAPGGWSQVLAVKYQTPGDDTSPGGVTFDSGSTKIDISIGSLGHLLANEMLNSTTVIPTSFSEGPVKTLQKRTEVKNVRGYSEKDSVPLTAPLGSGLVSEWTAKGPFWGLPMKLHGYKASFVVCGRTIVVICKTTDSQWSAVKPVFDHVLASVAAGTSLQAEEQRLLNSLGLH